MSKQPPIQPKEHKRELDGVVVRKSGAKTVSVEVVRMMAHPLYGKQITRTKRYLVHDQEDAANVGDNVTIQESRPLSRRKRWVIRNKAV